MSIFQNPMTTWGTIWLQYGEHNNYHSKSSIMRLSTRTSMQTFEILQWKGILQKLLENLMFWTYPHNITYCNNLVKIRLGHWEHNKQWSNWIVIRSFVVVRFTIRNIILPPGLPTLGEYTGNTYPPNETAPVNARVATMDFVILLFCYFDGSK